MALSVVSITGKRENACSWFGYHQPDSARCGVGGARPGDRHAPPASTAQITIDVFYRDSGTSHEVQMLLICPGRYEKTCLDARLKSGLNSQTGWPATTSDQR